MNIPAHALIILTVLTLAACGQTDEPTPESPSTADTPQASTGIAVVSHGGDREAVKLSDEQIAIAGITVAQAGPAKLRDVLPLYGAITPNAERVRAVSARFPGVIRQVNGKVGDRVQQGTTLATVESNESLQTYAVIAPLAGVITARDANAGEQTGDRTLFTVADLSTVWAELALFPRDVARVQVGQDVLVRSNDAGLSGRGTISYVAPFSTGTNQTLTARVRLDNSEGKWAPGLYVGAEVTLRESTAPLAVQSRALQTVNDTSVVFVKGARGFAVHPVKPGISDGEITEILEGLNPGDSYAAANSYVLKAEFLKREAAEE